MTPRFTRSVDISIPLQPARAMSLFTPEGERSWAGKDGWDPQYPVPGCTEGAGTVFLTQDPANTTVWVIVDHSTQRVRYARVSSDGLAGTVEVQVVAASTDATDVRVTYDLTAIREEAVDDLAQFATRYDADIGAWSNDIAEYLATEDLSRIA